MVIQQGTMKFLYAIINQSLGQQRRISKFANEKCAQNSLSSLYEKMNANM